MAWWSWNAIDSSNTIPTHLPFGTRRARSTGRTHIAPGTWRAPYCDVAISRIASKAACVLLSRAFLLRRKIKTLIGCETSLGAGHHLTLLRHYYKVPRFYFKHTVVTKIAIPGISLSTQDCSSLWLSTHKVTYPQRCFKSSCWTKNKHLPST
jgi:hypothetical protein